MSDHRPPSGDPPDTPSAPEGPTPPPTGLPDDVWSSVLAYSTGELDDDPAEIAALLLGWCEGRSADDLEQLLDALRDRGAYPISLEVLEAAWNSDLPPDRLGRIAEDWIGTVLHGIGDPDGAKEVAEHIAKGAREHGPQFEGDLGHVLLGWGMISEARPLVESAAAAAPGDLAAQFNLGVVRKLAGDWAAAKAAFELVLVHRDEPSARWNLGICAVALRDWATARDCWTRLNMPLPAGDGDYAAEGEPTPVRIDAPRGAPVHAEIVWGVRIGPARVELRGLPRFSALGGYGDVVLVDGVSAGETPYEGRMVPIVPALAAWQPSGGRTCALLGGQAGPAMRQAGAALVEALQNEGIPAADHTGLDGRNDLRLAIRLMPGVDGARLIGRIEQLKGALPLDLDPLRALAREAGR